MVMAVCLSATTAVHAFPLTRSSRTDANHASKVKQVSVNFRNNGSAPVSIMAGATEITIAPGKTASAKLNVGDRIVSEDATPTAPAGTLLALVAPQLNNATVVLH